ncbi:MAG: hypothetical protein Q9219_003711 [cf. Caloplaca sp. 3 TL-2023]
MPRAARKVDLPPERLTPVRIRGKRGQKARLQALRSRAKKMQSEESEPDPKPALSKFESLPTEILERIFLFGQDVALPQVSPTLGTVLSSNHIKHNLLRSLLTDKFPAWRPVRPRTSEIAGLQSKLLRCRWVDLPAIKRAFSATITSLIALALGKPTNGFFSTEELDQSRIQNILVSLDCPEKKLSELSPANFVDDVRASPEGEMSWTWYSVTGDMMLRMSINTNSGSLIIHGPRRPYVFYVRDGCEMPTRLLHGPWTPAKLEFQQFLWNAGAVLDPNNSSNHEVAEQGLREAIIQAHTQVVRLLVLREPARSPYLRRVEITAEHVRLAIFEGGCKQEIMRILAQASLQQDVDWDQPDIVAWATERAERGESRGVWILEANKGLKRQPKSMFMPMEKLITGHVEGW